MKMTLLKEPNSPNQGPLTVSIIIPVLNEEKYIANCLHSVFSQTYYSNIIEIFVIDGGSKDRTIEIVNQLSSIHPNLFLLNNIYKIQSAAFNIGLKKFKGDLLIRMDAHCIYDTQYIHYCVQYHSTSQYGNVGGRCSILPGSDTDMSKIIALVNSSGFGLGYAAFRVGKKMMYTDSVPFGSFNKEVLNRVGKMNESLPRGEDNEYNARIRKNGYVILFDPKIMSYYYAPPDLKSFLRKNYKNGFSIGVLVRVSPKSVSFRHLVPFLYIISLGIGIFLSFFHFVFAFALLLLYVIYFLLALISGITVISRDKIKLIPLYIYVVWLVHFYYGVGTVVGLIKGKFLRNSLKHT